MEQTFDVLSTVEAEREELEAKVTALAAFKSSHGFDVDVPETQRALLLMQYNAMELYLSVLDMRIDDLKANNNEPSNPDAPESN